MKNFVTIREKKTHNQVFALLKRENERPFELSYHYRVKKKKTLSFQNQPKTQARDFHKTQCEIISSKSNIPGKSFINSYEVFSKILKTTFNKFSFSW